MFLQPMSSKCLYHYINTVQYITCSFVNTVKYSNVQYLHKMWSKKNVSAQWGGQEHQPKMSKIRKWLLTTMIILTVHAMLKPIHLLSLITFCNQNQQVGYTKEGCRVYLLGEVQMWTDVLLPKHWRASPHIWRCTPWNTYFGASSVVAKMGDTQTKCCRRCC